MLRVTNTLTRTVEPLVPLKPGEISMYSCGPTVYRYAHVGNLRTYLLSDLVRRVCEYHGLQTQVVMNITDVGHMTDEIGDAGEDKMLLAARDEGKPAAEIAAYYTDAFLRDIEMAGIKRADAYPRASEHVPQMIELVSKLIERGHAYEKQGTVYYDVSTFGAYGSLSGQSLTAMRPGHRSIAVDDHKRNHQDFVLWKAAGPRRVVVFDSPWGSGYPGWHIECSAMSMHLLGPRFDVHTGGVDNVFPHHEDEIAQSEGVTGERVVSSWVHGDHLLVGSDKMAKSAGNVLTIHKLAADGHDPLAFRYLCYGARYRRQIRFTMDALAAAETGVRRLRERIASLDPTPAEAPATDTTLRASVGEPAAAAWQDRFVAAIDDDLDFPSAMKVLHEMLGDAGLAPATRAMLAASWDHILGLGLAAPTQPVPGAVRDIIRERDAARARRDFASADALRDRVSALGYDLVDTPSGTRATRRT